MAFNEDTGDRIAWTKVEQLQGGNYEVVAYYDMKTDNLTTKGMTEVWIGQPAEARVLEYITKEG